MSEDDESRPQWDRDWLIEKYYEEDLSMRHMADEAGCTHNSVRDQMRRHNVHPEQTDHTHPEEADIDEQVWRDGFSNPPMDERLYDHDWLFEQYWEEGLSQVDIADELDCGKNSVRRQFADGDIPTRSGLESQKLAKDLVSLDKIRARYNIGQENENESDETTDSTDFAHLKTDSPDHDWSALSD